MTEKPVLREPSVALLGSISQNRNMQLVNDIAHDIAANLTTEVATDVASITTVASRNHSANARFTALYAELHRIARREARRFGGGARLGTTTLLHEAYLQLVHRESLDAADDRHFLAYTARAMRGMVIDYQRAQSTAKRGGGVEIGSLDTFTAEQLAALPEAEALTQVSAALDDLARLDQDLALLVDLRFFCGFSMAEIAAQRGVTERTVQRQWEKARAWLFLALEDR
jgi:RNA polymerase sigma factor (TIGR02999 family)